MAKKIEINGVSIILASDTLKAKCVAEMMNIHKPFYEKALKYENNHKRISSLKKCLTLSFEGKSELTSLKFENDKIRPYLVKNIAEYKNNRQEWVFENIEATKITA